MEEKNIVYQYLNETILRIHYEKCLREILKRINDVLQKMTVANGEDSAAFCETIDIIENFIEEVCDRKYKITH